MTREEFDRLEFRPNGGVLVSTGYYYQKFDAVTPNGNIITRIDKQTFDEIGRKNILSHAWEVDGRKYRGYYIVNKILERL